MTDLSKLESKKKKTIAVTRVWHFMGGEGYFRHVTVTRVTPVTTYIRNKKLSRIENARGYALVTR